MIAVRALTKSFGEAVILDNIQFDIQDGEFVSLIGKSGSGKTTLLYAISSLEQPTKGEVLIDGKDIYAISQKEVHAFRNQSLGFVFQFHYLLPELNAYENITMPLRKQGIKAEHYEYIEHLLELFELSEHRHKRPSQLSGGQQQRVAIARAVVNKPRYLFADEPTGALDSKNSDSVMDIFKTLNQTYGTTIICVTHDMDFAGMADRTIYLKDGRVVSKEDF